MSDQGPPATYTAAAHAPVAAPGAAGRAASEAPAPAGAGDDALGPLRALFEAVAAALEKAGLGDTLDAAATVGGTARATAATAVGTARATAATAVDTARATAVAAAGAARSTAATAVDTARATAATAIDTALATAATAADTARATAATAVTTARSTAAAAAAVPARALERVAAATAGVGAAAGTLSEGVGAAAGTLSEIAGIITAMAKEGSLPELLTHPGAATVGVYYLARRHQMERRGEPLDGSHVGDGELVHDLLHYVDLSDAAYPDRYSDVLERGRVLHEGDVLFHNKDAGSLPGFFIARDPERKRIMWVLHGPEGEPRALADLCGEAAPIPGGGYAHAGMWQSALWLMDNHLERVIEALAAHPGYALTISGHSTGAGIAALVAYVLSSNAEVGSKLGGAKVDAFCIAPAACMSSDVAAACGGYVTSLVMRYDLVPRLSSVSIEALREELLSVDYKGLLSEDILAIEPVRKAVEATTAAAHRIRAQERARAALSKAHSTATAVAQKVAANPKLLKLEKAAQDAAGTLAGRIDRALAPGEGGEARGPGFLAQLAAEEEAAGHVPVAEEALQAIGAKVSAATDAALANERVRGALGWVSAILKKAATAHPGAGRDVSASDVAGAKAVNEAAAAGSEAAGGGDGAKGGAAAAGGAAAERVSVALYAPGRILWLRPIDESVPEAQHKFELVDTGCDARFQRIVLRASCVSDHQARSARAALVDVLSRLKTPAGAALQQE